MKKVDAGFRLRAMRLKEHFVLEERGWVDVKGKGRMQTWFLVGHK